MIINSIIVKKIWELVMLFVITNGFGGAILVIQDMMARGMRRINRGNDAVIAGECAA